MDLSNNAVGRDIGKDNPKAPVNILVAKVQEKRETGELRVFENPADNKSRLAPSELEPTIEVENK